MTRSRAAWIVTCFFKFEIKLKEWHFQKQLVNLIFQTPLETHDTLVQLWAGPRQVGLVPVDEAHLLKATTNS